MAELTGVSPEDAAGRPIETVLTATADDGMPVSLGDELLAVADDPQLSGQSSLVVRTPEGDRRDVALSLSAMFSEGQRTGTVVLAVDMTRQREVDRLKDDFLMRVSHELLTPITPIRGYAESLLRLSDRLDETQRRESLQRIIDSSNRLTRTVHQLLVVARMREDQRETLRLDRFAVAGPLQAVVKAAVRLHPGRRVEVTGDPGGEVVADRAKLGEILSTLLDNALRYSPHDSPVTVEVRSDELVTISVIDRGRGIAQNQLKQVFERFHRVEDPLTMETGGLGVGLFVAQRLSGQLGGALNVESQLGRGSTFRLTLPAASPTHVSDDAAAVFEEASAAAGERSRGDESRIEAAS